MRRRLESVSLLGLQLIKKTHIVFYFVSIDLSRIAINASGIAKGPKTQQWFFCTTYGFTCFSSSSEVSTNVPWATGYRAGMAIGQFIGEYDS